MIDLKDRVVLVTGAGRGIGAAVARAAVRCGGSAVVHDVTAERADALRRELGAERCAAVAGDLADAGAVPRIWNEAVAWRGRIDVLVNNAGIYEPADPDGDFAAWDRAWRRTLEINLVAPGHFCREAIRHFRARGGGVIVNLASRAGFRGDDADFMHYAASKGAILAMTRTIARHFGRDGITAFAVAPGFVRTDLNAKFFAEHGVAAAEKDIPLGAIAEPEDVANTICFLASGLARHSTGSTIDINGASYVR